MNDRVVPNETQFDDERDESYTDYRKAPSWMSESQQKLYDLGRKHGRWDGWEDGFRKGFDQGYALAEELSEGESNGDNDE